MGVISPWHWITWRRWLMQWSGPSPSGLSFQLAEERYKKEERKGVEGQTTMHTSIAADYIRRSVSVRVKWSADVVLLGWKFKSAQLRMLCCVGGSSYQAMKRMEHVKSNRQLDRSLESNNSFVMAGLPDNIPSPVVIPVLDSVIPPRLEGLFLW